MPEEYRLTPKLALWIGAILSLVLFVLSWRRGWTVVAGVFLGLAIFLAVEAHNIRSWCAPPEAHFGKLVWGQHAWHEPSLWECLRLVRPHG